MSKDVFYKLENYRIAIDVCDEDIPCVMIGKYLTKDVVENIFGYYSKDVVDFFLTVINKLEEKDQRIAELEEQLNSAQVGEQFALKCCKEAEEQLKNAIVLPISVGQEIYYLYKEDIDGDVNYTIEKGFVVSISIGVDSNWFFAIYNIGLSFWHLLEDFNSEVFATKEEALEKLKELQSNDN